MNRCQFLIVLLFSVFALAAQNLDETYQPLVGSRAYVSSVTELPDKNLIVAGSFTEIENHQTQWLAKITKQGEVDFSFQTNFTGVFGDKFYTITEVVEHEGLLYVSFMLPEGSPMYTKVLRLHSNGSLDNTFKAEVDENFASVNSIAFQSTGKILIGGMTDELYRYEDRVQRLNSDGSADTTFRFEFDYPGGPYGFNYLGDGHEIDVFPDDSFLFPKTGYGLIKINANGQVDTTFQAFKGGFESHYKYVRLQDQSIFISGNFSTANGDPSTGAVLLNPDGSVKKVINVLPDNSEVITWNLHAFDVYLDDQEIFCIQNDYADSSNNIIVYKFDLEGNYKSKIRFDNTDYRYSTNTYYDDEIKEYHSFYNREVFADGISFGTLTYNQQGVLKNTYMPFYYKNINHVKGFFNDKGELYAADLYSPGVSAFNNITRLTRHGIVDNSFIYTEKVEDILVASNSGKIVATRIIEDPEAPNVFYRQFELIDEYGATISQFTSYNLYNKTYKVHFFDNFCVIAGKEYKLSMGSEETFNLLKCSYEGNVTGIKANLPQNEYVDYIYSSSNGNIIIASNDPLNYDGKIHVYDSGLVFQEYSDISNYDKPIAMMDSVFYYTMSFDSVAKIIEYNIYEKTAQTIATQIVKELHPLDLETDSTALFDDGENILRLNLRDGGYDRAFDMSYRGDISQLSVYNDEAYINGIFYSFMNSQKRTNLVKVNLKTDSLLAPIVNGNFNDELFTLNITWEDLNWYEDGYEIFWDINGGFELKASAPKNSSEVVLELTESELTVLKERGSVEFKLRAFNQTRYSDFSNSLVFDFAAILSEVKAIDLIRLYPNPSEGLFHLELQGQPHLIKVYDSSGKSIAPINENKLSSNDRIIDLRLYPNGLYFVKIIIGEKVQTLKILKHNK